MRKPVPRAVTQFVTLIRERTGNVVPRARYDFLGELIERRARALGQPDLASYVHLLSAGRLEDEWRQLVPLITIKESYFFRAPQQFQMLQRVLLPRLVRAHSDRRRLRVWSAACARGEEPGTLAIVLAESGLLANWDWQILATDVDEDALEAARRGIYGERAVAQVPPDLLSRYFEPRGKLYELAGSVRGRIDYRRLNLAEATERGLPGLPAEPFDFILLRNVLIYFPRPLQRRVVEQVGQRLAADGHLFLGASETLWQIQDDLVPLDLGNCFCYRHPQPGEERPVVPPRIEGGPDRPLPVYQPVVRMPEPPPAPEPPKAPEPPPEPDPMEELREVVPELPATPPCAVQERLSEAARELAGNRLDDARRLLDEALTGDPSEPAAHALEGFLHDLEGRTDEAIGSYRGTLYLDPSLFQVRLLLADCWQRTGARDRARQQYQEVLATLESGRGRELVTLGDLPLPNRTRAERRCRQVLRGR